MCPKKVRMGDQIEIKIDGEKLRPEKFLEAAKSFFDLIQGVAKNVSEKAIDWTIAVDKGSAILRATVENPTPKSKEAIQVICRGIRSLRSGIRAIPNGFTRDEIRAAKNLAALVDSRDIRSIFLKDGDLPEEISPNVLEVADSILSGETHQAFGSLEGKIDSLSDKHGFSCSIYVPQLGREVVCYFSKDDIQEEAIKGFRKRVLVGGLIRYAKEGHPTSVVVDTVRIFPEESELPTIEEVQSLFN